MNRGLELIVEVFGERAAAPVCRHLGEVVLDPASKELVCACGAVLF